MTLIHAFADDALGEDDALGVARRIKDGDVGRSEVIEAAIARLELVGDQLGAVQVVCPDRARNQPVTAGPFSGVPSFIKDNTDVAGLPTCHGSQAFTPHPAKADGPPARQFLAQGFVLLGKSTLPEFGLTASTEYVDLAPTRNPWHTDFSAGASSGGAAALVAAGVVPIAHANDGGGSIRIPAAANGLVGLKATRRRLLDQPGIRQMPVNLVSEGVVTRTVRDTAHYLAAAERFRPAPGLEPVGLVAGPGNRRIRIGVIRRDIFGRAVHPANDAVLTSAAEVLAGQGHAITEMRLLSGAEFVQDFTAYWALFAVAMSASFKLRHGRHINLRRLDPFTKGLTRTALRHAHHYFSSIPRLRAATAMYDAHFAELDVLLMPVLAHPVPPIGELSPEQPFQDLMDKLTDYVAFTPLANVGGGPAISVPHGRTGGGLPGSVQLCAPRGDERTLLELAYHLEQASPFPRITDEPETTPGT